MSTKPLERRPEAGAESVEDLVQRAVNGEVRIPAFQRPLKWEASDVVDLFDSVYHGYPIGALLFRMSAGEAGPLRLGPLDLYGAETDRALWVVDGQQRLTSLAAGLARPPPAGDHPPRDPFVVYFDPREGRFHPAPRSGPAPAGWVPVSRLRDAATLSEWVFAEWPDGKDGRLRAAVFEAGKRLREYRVPYYVIETPDEDVAKLIFDRVNSRGKQLDREDVFNALFGQRGGAPSTLGELAAELQQLGMGSPDEESQLLPGIAAMLGLDVTRPFSELAREHPEKFERAMPRAAPVFRRALAFLRLHAEIPHLRLLPFSAPLVVLCSYFERHHEPSSRSVTLLVRWVWRCFLSPSVDDRTLRRQGINAIEADEEASVQALLRLVDRQRQEPFRLPARFDARAADTRVALLALAAAGPLADAEADARRVDLVAEIAQHDRDAFRVIFPGSGRLLGSPANRILLPGPGSARRQLEEIIRQGGRDTTFLRSHLVDPAAAAALIAGDDSRFIEARGRSLGEAVDAMAARLAEWGQNDRPSIEHLLAEVGDA